MLNRETMQWATLTEASLLADACQLDLTDFCELYSFKLGMPTLQQLLEPSTFDELQLDDEDHEDVPEEGDKGGRKALSIGKEKKMDSEEEGALNNDGNINKKKTRAEKTKIKAVEGPKVIMAIHSKALNWFLAPKGKMHNYKKAAAEQVSKELGRDVSQGVVEKFVNAMLDEEDPEPTGRGGDARMPQDVREALQSMRESRVTYRSLKHKRKLERKEKDAETLKGHAFRERARKFRKHGGTLADATRKEEAGEEDSSSASPRAGRESMSSSSDSDPKTIQALQQRPGSERESDRPAEAKSTKKSSKYTKPIDDAEFDDAVLSKKVKRKVEMAKDNNKSKRKRHDSLLQLAEEDKEEKKEFREAIALLAKGLSQLLADSKRRRGRDHTSKSDSDD